MNRQLIPAALVLFCLNFAGFLLVDKYCDFFFKYRLSWPLPGGLENRPWFRKLLRSAHVLFGILALLLPFLIPTSSE